MRISDWSSDVCSSDLSGCRGPGLLRQEPRSRASCRLCRGADQGGACLQYLGPRCERGLRAPAWAQWHAGDRAQRRGGARGVSAARLPREVAQGGAVMTRRASRRRRLSLACALILCSAVALGGCATFGGNIQIGRAHVCNPVTNAHLVCRLLLEK